MLINIPNRLDTFWMKMSFCHHHHHHRKSRHHVNESVLRVVVSVSPLYMKRICVAAVRAK
jgi:hypothetical protein